VKQIGGLILGLAVGLGVGWALWRGGAGGAAVPAPVMTTPFQAVLLTTGQVYYGRISGLETDYPILRDVYYIQTATDPNTKAVTNVLIRRGQEWHGPDYTVLNARHIALVEPVSEGSKVAQLIAEQEKQGK
jgi:hypothetical protein